MNNPAAIHTVTIIILAWFAINIAILLTMLAAGWRKRRRERQRGGEGSSSRPAIAAVRVNH
jgi:hypothetical protein